MRKNCTFPISSVLFLMFALVSCSGGSEDGSAIEEEMVGLNQLTQAEIDDGWVLLFDGTTSEGWTGYNKDAFPNGWQIEDGALFCKGSGRGEAGGVEGGDIVYEKPFSNFHLKLE